jgi:hypothetical protein
LNEAGEWVCQDETLTFSLSGTQALGETGQLGPIAIIFSPKSNIPTSAGTLSFSSSTEEEDNRLKTTLTIAGSVIGSVVGMAAIGGAIAFFFFYRRKEEFESEGEGSLYELESEDR